jgi:hypothetical protein
MVARESSFLPISGGPLTISRVCNSQVDEMIREADVNGDGIIDYKEFTKIILN